MGKKVSVMCALGTTVVLTMAGMASAAYSHLDTFSLNGSNRYDGASLNYQYVEQGNVAKWTVMKGGAASTTNNVVFTANGTVTSNSTTSGDNWAKFTLSPSSESFNVEADVNPTGTAWTGLFVKGWNDVFTDVAGSQLLVFLRPNGNYKVIARGIGASSITIKNDTPCPNFVSNGMNHISLQYDKDAKTVSVYLNGQKGVDNYNLGAFTPAFNSTGFYFASTSTAGTAQIDNFRVSVPEPSTLAFLGLCGLSMLRRFKK